MDCQGRVFMIACFPTQVPPRLLEGSVAAQGWVPSIWQLTQGAGAPPASGWEVVRAHWV